MKILLIFFLMVFSSVAIANYISPPSGYPYQAYTYSPHETAWLESSRQIREDFYNQQRMNNEINHQIQLEKNERSYQRMREYYQDRRDTERFIGD